MQEHTNHSQEQTRKQERSSKSKMRRFLIFTYGSAAYAIFLATFLYAVAFIGDMAVPKTIDSGPAAPFWEALLVNTALLGLFAVQHSGMARRGFKKVLTKLVPWEMERATYVLATCAVLILMYWQWRPMPELVWSVQDPAGRTALETLFFAGWGIMLVSTFMIHHFDLFGMRQAYMAAKGEPYRHLGFRVPGFYKYVRHPIQVGFLIAFWSTPDMTMGHLLFSLATTGYIFIAVKFFEEPDLVREFGDRYRNYMQQVGGFIPAGVYRKDAKKKPSGEWPQPAGV